MQHWVALSATRTSNGFGPNPLSRHDIHAYEADERISLANWERRALFRIDAAYRMSLVPPEDRPKPEEA